MAKTVHVYRSGTGWVVKREGKASAVFATKEDAVKRARRLATKSDAIGQVVIHQVDGRFISRATHKLPKIQEPPRKSSLGTKNIERAVSKVVRERLSAD